MNTLGVFRERDRAFQAVFARARPARRHRGRRGLSILDRDRIDIDQIGRAGRLPRQRQVHEAYKHVVILQEGGRKPTICAGYINDNVSYSEQKYDSIRIKDIKNEAGRETSLIQTVEALY